jgi:DNA-binding PadR family transcriptional regulator
MSQLATTYRAPVPRPLGAFSYLVMRIIETLPPRERYGLRIEEAITLKLKDFHIAQIYVTLKRLEAKGYIKGSPATTPRGSKHKITLYRITTPAGRKALDASRAFYRALHELSP